MTAPGAAGPRAPSALVRRLRAWWPPSRWEQALVLATAGALAAQVAVVAGAPGALLGALRLVVVAAALGALRDPAARWVDGWRLLLVLVALWALPSVYGRVGGDGVQCYVLLRSPLLDGDLDFANDYAGLGARAVRSVEGEVTTRFPIGLSVLWAPAFLLAHVAAHVAHALGAPVAADGFGPLYQAAVTTASFAYGLGALLLLERALRRSYPRALAAGVVLVLYLATPLHFYTTANPSMTHAGSVFAATLLVLAWLRARERGTARAWAWVGAAAGLAAWVRPQDAALLVVPLADLLFVRGADGRVPRLLALLGPAAGMAAVQVAVWLALYGTGFVGVIQDQSYVGRTELQVVDLLFSARHGLFTWTPVYLAAAAGWLLWVRRAPRLAALFLLGFAAAVAVNAGMQDWWGSEAFGQRRLLALTPLFAWGLAEAGAALLRRPGLALWSAAAALVVWNVQLESIYNSQVIATRTQAVSLDRLAAAQVDMAYARLLRMEGRLPRRVWALLYEYTRGIWIDEGPRSLGGMVDVGSEPPDLPQVLGPGWHDPESEDGVAWRRLRGRRAWIRVPVRAPADYQMVVRARATGAPMLLRVDVNEHDGGEALLSADWGEHAFAVPSSALRRGFNDVRVMTRPAAEGGAGSVAVDWIRFTRTAVRPGPR